MDIAVIDVEEALIKILGGLAGLDRGLFVHESSLRKVDISNWTILAGMAGVGVTFL